MTWYMVRDSGNAYYGPFDLDRARREATNRAVNAPTEIYKLVQTHHVAPREVVITELSRANAK